MLLNLLFQALFLLLTGVEPIDAPLVPTGLEGAALLAVVAMGAALVWATVQGIDARASGDGAAVVAESLKRKSERTPVAPLVAPDTPGKPRPRAPGHVAAAA